MKDRAIVKQSYTIYRSAPFSMTLNDLN